VLLFLKINNNFYFEIPPCSWVAETEADCENRAKELEKDIRKEMLRNIEIFKGLVKKNW
jgi:hypothetical protein